MDEISKTSLPILNLLLILAESAVGFVQSEKLAVGIVLRVQPDRLSNKVLQKPLQKRKPSRNNPTRLEEAATYSPT